MKTILTLSCCILCASIATYGKASAASAECYPEIEEMRAANQPVIETIYWTDIYSIPYTFIHKGERGEQELEWKPITVNIYLDKLEDKAKEWEKEAIKKINEKFKNSEILCKNPIK